LQSGELSPLYNPEFADLISQMLEVRNLSICFRAGKVRTPAVQSLSFSVEQSQTLAIVGESGSGKSVTAMALTKLLPTPPASYETGEILLDGESILSMDEKRLRSIRGKRIAYIFQEPAISKSLKRFANIAEKSGTSAKKWFIGLIRLESSIHRNDCTTILFSLAEACSNGS
jgi:ABC-type dipeptide/oligopeptide/nickel transport system ATPase component